MLADSALDVSLFFPIKDLEITEVDNRGQAVIIRLKSITSSCECPKCHNISSHYHGVSSQVKCTFFRHKVYTSINPV